MTLLLVSLLVTVLIGCGSDDTSQGATTTTQPQRAVTFDEAARLGRALHLNQQLGGASFTIDAPIADGVSLHGAGEVDWMNHFGQAELVRRESGSEPSAADERAVFWAPEATLEGRLPGFVPPSGTSGPDAWVQRPADPDQNVLDRLLAFVMTLAAVRDDNPALVQQEGAVHLGEEQVDGELVDIFGFGRSTYWVTRDEGRLVRYQADVTGLPGEVVVTLADHGPRELATPSMAQVTDVVEAGEAYVESAGAWPFSDAG